MSLHLERLGESGPELVFIHGWGLPGGVWREVAGTLSAGNRVTSIDLPGHGHSRMTAPEFTLASAAEAVAAALPPSPTVIGWSLGGLVALQLALRHPTRVRRLVLVGSTPQFTADAAWPWAMEAGTLEAFARQLREDHPATIRRFLALQVLGSDDGRRVLARLKAEVDAAPPPDGRALAGGLAVLREASLVAHLDEIRLPVTVIHGERDTLVPAQAARETAARLPDGRLHVLAGAGHAPFLAQHGAFCDLIQGLADE